MEISPGFSAEEALMMLGMAVGADVLTPTLDPSAPTGPPITTQPADDADNPIPHDDGTTTPYPWDPIWPTGWTPAVDSGDTAHPWAKSVLISPLGNTAILAHHAESDRYALAFAGTANADNIAEDLASFMVSAGAVDIEQKVLGAPTLTYRSDARYVRSLPAPTTSPQPEVQSPRVHFGFRVALESLTHDFTEAGLPHMSDSPTRTLGDMFTEVGRRDIDLYVTGHSLGAPLASLCMAWLTNTAIPDVSFGSIKCYTFASPKVGNDAFAYDFDLAHTTPGMCFRVVNNLDTIPQFPLTYERLDTDVNNPAMITALAGHMGWKQKYYIEGFTGKTVTHIFDFFTKDPMPKLDSSVAFVHIGNPIVLDGEFPVVYTESNWPKQYFPGLDASDLPAISEMDQQWWQHHMPIYATSLIRQFST